MFKSFRVLALCLAGGILAGTGFYGTQVLADSFSDVPPSNTFAADIDWLTDYDIADGFPGGTFRPTDSVNRGQAARWFRRYNSKITITESTTNPTSAGTFTHSKACGGSDYRPIAGGGSTSTSDLFITDSYPFPPDGFGSPGGWRVRWETDNNSNVDPTSVTVWVTCVPRL